MKTKTDFRTNRLVRYLELAEQLIAVEQRVDAYQRLYDEELDEIRRSIRECRKQILSSLTELRKQPAVDGPDSVGEPDA